MSTGNSESLNLTHAAERVADHLLNQVEAGNPLLQDPSDQFTAIATITEFNGSERAFDMGWPIVREQTATLGKLELEDFAEAAVKYRGSQGAREAAEIARHMDDQPNNIIKARILTLAAESTDDPDLRAAVVEKADAVLEECDPEKLIMHTPSQLYVRLGVASEQPGLIERAKEKLDSTNVSSGFEVMEAIAKALGNRKSVKDDPLRPALIDTAIAVHAAIALPATIPRYNYQDVLSQDELQGLVGAVQGDGGRPFMTWRAFREKSGIFLPMTSELREFNRMTSQANGWVSPQEHARFATTALLGRFKRDNTRLSSGSFMSAAFAADRVVRAITTDPVLRDARVLDDTLEHGIIMRDAIPKGSARDAAHLAWSYGLMPALNNIEIGRADARYVLAIHGLRNVLPLASASRIKLNGKLAGVGDYAALIDSAAALTSDPELILTEPKKNRDTKEVVRKPYIWPYRFDFFGPVNQAVKRLTAQ